MNKIVENSILVIILFIIVYFSFKYYNNLLKLHTDCFCVSLKVYVIVGLLSLLYLIYHAKYHCHKYHENSLDLFNGGQKVWLISIGLSLLVLFSNKIFYILSG
jgi:hypothetical protein